MCQIAVSGFVLAPASSHLPAQDGELVDGWLTPLIINGEAVQFRGLLGNLRLELVNLPSSPCLSPIESTRVQKERPSHLMAVQIDYCGSYKRPHSPIEAENGLHVFPCLRRFDRHLH